MTRLTQMLEPPLTRWSLYIINTEVPAPGFPPPGTVSPEIPNRSFVISLQRLERFRRSPEFAKNKQEKVAKFQADPGPDNFGG